MATISLRLSEKDEQLFKKYAEVHGMSLTELIRSSVLEKIEDESDLAALQEALKNPNPEYYTLDEVERELGL